MKIGKYMISYMNDSAYDCQHVYRVLYLALEIATDFDIATDVLSAAALLYDIGREAQFRNPDCDHAIIGADMASEFLQSIGWTENKTNHVKECIATHRYRNNNIPASIEAKILFDADKLDVTGAMGIARTLACKGIVSELYILQMIMAIIVDGKQEKQTSFFQEYNWKLKNVYDKFYTQQAKAIAESRRKASQDFYESLYSEVYLTHQKGMHLLENSIENR